jgi:hypothetical protein
VMGGGGDGEGLVGRGAGCDLEKGGVCSNGAAGARCVRGAAAV